MSATQMLVLPTTLAAYRFRPMRREDLPAVHGLLLEADRVDGTTSAGLLNDLYTQFDDPWSDPATDARVFEAANSQIAAMARVYANPRPEVEVRAYLSGVVHPKHRARGLGAFILDWLESRATQRLGPAGILRTTCPDDLADRIALFERRGFRPVRYFYRMRRDLRQAIPEGPLPDGMIMRPYGPDLELRTLNAFNEAFRDHWGYEPVTEADWRQFWLDRTAFREDLTPVALDGEEVIGFSYNTVSAEENARHGVREGWIADLAVRRPWRRRGVATALLCQTMRGFAAEGLDYATLGVDTENPSGALGLYTQLGFEAVKRFVTYEKAVRAGARRPARPEAARGVP